jgi:hypothetical protein
VTTCQPAGSAEGCWPRELKAGRKLLRQTGVLADFGRDASLGNVAPVDNMSVRLARMCLRRPSPSTRAANTSGGAIIMGVN